MVSAVNVAPIRGFYCIPAIIPNNKTWKVKLRSFINEYTDDMVDPTSLHAEIDLWGDLRLKNQAQYQRMLKRYWKQNQKAVLSILTEFYIY